MANLLFQNALSGIPQNTPPIWFMRQAGRYHKHYQNLRSKYSFMDLCKIPELAAETAMGPIRDFDFDVAILFSDLLFPLEALGMGLEYTEKGPQLGFLLNPETWPKLKATDEAFQGLLFQGEAVKYTREVLPKNKSLVGFVGSPWTLFVYATQGTHKGHLENAKGQMELFNAFAQIIVPLLKRNIALQIDAGAEIVMIFDTAAGEMSPHSYRKYILPHIENLAEAFPKKLAYYIKGGTSDHFLGTLWQNGKTRLAGLGFDHRWDLAHVLKQSAEERHLFIQGNFDQSLLLTSNSSFKEAVEDYLEPIKLLSPIERRGWVSGLGHGVLPQTPESHVRHLVNRIREVFN